MGSITIYYLLSSIFRAVITTDAGHANEAESYLADTCLVENENTPVTKKEVGTLPGFPASACSDNSDG